MHFSWILKKPNLMATETGTDITVLEGPYCRGDYISINTSSGAKKLGVSIPESVRSDLETLSMSASVSKPDAAFGLRVSSPSDRGQVTTGEVDSVECNICQGQSFEAGPKGRTSMFTKKLPKCSQCGSLERHRIIFGVWKRMLESGLEFDDKLAIQFSQERAVEPGWFKSLEESIFGVENSLDLQSIDRPNGAYDVAICNHVLEHVQHDDQAMRELMRILRSDGFLQFTVPGPRWREVTEDWGCPKPEVHQHYRIYGRDLLERFSAAQPGIYIMEVPGQDDVTGEFDFVYFATLDEARLAAIRSSLTSSS